MKNQLAVFGGKKSIPYKSPHWNWPIQSKDKLKSIIYYYKKLEKKKINGYPFVVKEFEKNFAGYHKSKFALALNSGTSALQASFFAIGLKKGDEIITPALTFHATASPINTVNATPVIVDCEKDTGNISPESIIKNLSKRTKAIVITHLCGHPCEMEAILKISKKYKLFLIEDCSHAHGSTYKGRKVGTFGDIGVFSLDSNKLISAGEGGILITNNRKFYQKALLLSDFGPRVVNEVSMRSLSKFKDTGLGYKHRIHPVSAVIANNELKKINYYIKKRRQVLNAFSKRIKQINGLSPPVTKKYVTRGAFFGYRPFVDKKKLNNIGIKKFIKFLQAEGMEVRQAGNVPLHLMSLFNKKHVNSFLNKDTSFYKDYKAGDLPNSEKFYNTTLSIPTFTFENIKIINSYIVAFKKVCNYLSKK